MPPFIEPATESFLIKKVQNKADSEALTILTETHTGIYSSVINRYAKCYPNVIKREDLMDDKPLNMWRFILDYKPDRGAKLSTFIGYKTDYLCRELLQKGRTTAMGIATGNLGVSLDDDQSGVKMHEVIPDTSKKDAVFDSVNHSLGMEDIFDVAEKFIEDKRFSKILRLRYPSSGISTSWRKIGKEVDLSHEAVRLIYNAHISELKRKVTKKIKMTLTELSRQVHQANIKWWRDINTGKPLQRNKGELLALIHSELSEAFDGEMIDANDDKLSHRKAVEVELVDALIRVLDYAAGFGYDLSKGIKEGIWKIFDFSDLSDLLDPMTFDQSFLKADLARKGIAGFHSRISAILEHERKNRTDAVEIDLAEFVTTLLLYGHFKGYDLQGAFQEKMDYNSKRKDHTHEARKADGGKKF